MTKKLEEKISQFLDGELDSMHYDEFFKHIKHAAHQDTWSRYHLAGDAQRKELPDFLQHDLAERVHQKLQSEPNLFIPNAMSDTPPAMRQAHEQSPKKSANDQAVALPKRAFAGWGFALAASVALVGVISVQLGMQTNNEAQPGFAQIQNFSQADRMIAQQPSVRNALSQPVAGIDRPVVKPLPSQILTEEDIASHDQWKRLDLDGFSPRFVEQQEFSNAPGKMPQQPLAHTASFGNSE